MTSEQFRDPMTGWTGPRSQQATVPEQLLHRTIFEGDNLEMLRGFNSGSVGLIYLDPPFNSKREWNAPIGSKAAEASFKDTWTLDDVDLEWHDQLAVTNPALHDVIRAARGACGDGTMSYLLMMSVRLLELYRVLKDNGSIYLHCDPTESHSLKLMMDTIFGRDQFRNEIIWSYGLGGSSSRYFSKKHDTLLFYTKGDDYYFDKPQVRATSQMMKGKLKGATDVWPIPSLNNMSKERVGYPTQKPVSLLERILLASSSIDDLVLDPFCGCGTALIAAQKHNRRWVGIDYSAKAAELVERRLRDELGIDENLVNPAAVIPSRTDLGDLPHYKTHKTALYLEQDGYCNLCGVWFSKGNLSVDHIVSRKKGGTDEKRNLHLLCRECNSRKGTRTWESIQADYFGGRRARWR